MKTAIFLLLAILFSVDSVMRLRQGYFDLGVFLIYCATGLLWIYTVFHKQIDAWCSFGIGKILKLLFLFGICVMICLMAFIHFSGQRTPPDGTEKAMIVLGASVRNDTPSPSLKYRLDAAYEYAVKHPDIPVVVSGGQGADESRPEADVMAEYLINKGLSEERIWKEDKSQSTQENFLFSQELLEKHGITEKDPIVFVTNQFHCYRSEGYAKRAGFENVHAIPAGMSSTSVLPVYLREVFAVLYFWCFA